MDLQIFNAESDQCFANISTNVETKSSNTISISSCIYLQRMLYALKYHQSLESSTNPSNTDTFLNFCDEVYGQLLNDYEHIINIHQRHIEDINDQLIMNENKECTLFSRYHHRESFINKQNETDSKIIFHKDVLDSMHNFLFHLFETGMRIKSKSIINEPDDNDQDNDMEQHHVDIILGKITTHVQNKKQQLNLYDSDRFSDGTNDKFTLNVESNNSRQQQTETAFIDVLFDEMKKISLPTKIRNKLAEYSQQESYDSDALEMDKLTQSGGSNIINVINAKTNKLAMFLSEYIEEINRMLSLFC